MTVVIDTDSDPGAWATAIAHTPHLAAQISDSGAASPLGRVVQAGAGFPPLSAPAVFFSMTELRP